MSYDGGDIMNVIEKIVYLSDRQNGLGIPMTIIGKYCGCHPTSITYYLKGAVPKDEVVEKYEWGLHNLLNDMKQIIEG